MNEKPTLWIAAKTLDVLKLIISVVMIYLVFHSGQAAQAAEVETGIISGTLGNSSLLQQSMQSIFRKTPRPLSNAQLSSQHYVAAVRHLTAGDTDKAENNLGLALSYDEHNTHARDLLATLYSKTGRNELAITILQNESVFDRLSFTSAMLLANLLADKGDVPGAITVLQRMLPTQLGNQQEQQQEYQQYYQQYYATLAALFYRDAQYARAQQIYKSLLQQNPNNSIWWLGLGVTLEASARTQAALKAYEQAKQHGMAHGVVGQFVDKRISILSQQLSTLTTGQAS